MTEHIIDGTELDTSVFSYSQPKAHKSGGKVVNLYNKYSQASLAISTPLMLTWGAQEGQDGNKMPNGKYTMALQFPSSDFANENASKFLDSMRRLETQVKLDAMKYSKEWFGKEIKSIDVIEEKFNVMLRHPKKEKGSLECDYSRPPTMTIKIPQWNGVWKPEIYDEDGNPLYINGKVNSHMSPLSFLLSKVHLMALIECGGLWFVNGKISITWNLKQAIVQKPKTIVEGVCFLRPNPVDKERIKTLPAPEQVDPDGVGSVTIVEDDDDVQLDDIVAQPAPAPEPAPAPAPAPAPEPVVTEVEEVKPKKKIVRKKVDA